MYYVQGLNLNLNLRCRLLSLHLLEKVLPAAKLLLDREHLPQVSHPVTSHA